MGNHVTEKSRYTGSNRQRARRSASVLPPSSPVFLSDRRCKCPAVTPQREELFQEGRTESALTHRKGVRCRREAGSLAAETCSLPGSANREQPRKEPKTRELTTNPQLRLGQRSPSLGRKGRGLGRLQPRRWRGRVFPTSCVWWSHQPPPGWIVWRPLCGAELCGCPRSFCQTRIGGVGSLSHSQEETALAFLPRRRNMTCGQQQQPLPPPRKITNVGPCISSRRRTSPSSPSSARNVWSCLIVVTGLLDWPSLLLLRPRCRGHLPSPGLPRRRLGKESACQSANAEDLGGREGVGYLSGKNPLQSS
ncbi:uncharacterized protein [Odocoileus virginianus]|uniref:Uncharacterized protein n=1 Tax=Odocoileus virginianus TaxID=9874 RepID=A0ABM4IW51_ODOVR